MARQLTLFNEPPPIPVPVSGHLRLLGVSYSLEAFDGWIPVNYFRVIRGPHQFRVVARERTVWVDPMTIRDDVYRSYHSNPAFELFWGFGPRYVVGSNRLAKLTEDGECVAFDFIGRDGYELVERTRRETANE